MVVATAAACQEVVRDRRYGVRTRAGGTPGGAVDGSGHPPRARRPVLLGLDPPEHTRLRRPWRRPSPRPRVAEREDLAARLAARLVDAAARQGRFDLVADVAVPLPVAIIADILGVPDADADAFAHWGRAVGAGLGGVRSLGALHRLERAVVELRALMADLLARRRRRPGGAAGSDDAEADVLDRLAAEDVADDEAVSLAVLLLLAGFETTSGLIGNAVAAMLDAEEPWRRLADDPLAAAADIVEETLRYDPPVQFTARVPHVEVELGVRTLAPDTTVLAMLDRRPGPGLHTDPDTFDPTRPTAGEHLAFSGGIHYCLGAPWRVSRRASRWPRSPPGRPGCDVCPARRDGARCC